MLLLFPLALGGPLFSLWPCKKYWFWRPYCYV